MIWVFQSYHSHLVYKRTKGVRERNPKFCGGSDGKASVCNVENRGSIPGLGRSPGKGNGKPLRYSCLENPMDGAGWQAIVHGVAKSQTQLSKFTHLT